MVTRCSSGIQAPLYEGSIEFQGGWTLGDFVRELNRRVFFWSGWERGLVESGKNHFGRYQQEGPTVIRVRFDTLRGRNAELTPYFCKYNSGGPRCYRGKGSPRGPDTFSSAEHCQSKRSDVVEVTFLEPVALPTNVEVSDHIAGPWEPLFADSRSARARSRSPRLLSNDTRHSPTGSVTGYTAGRCEANRG